MAERSAVAAKTTGSIPAFRPRLYMPAVDSHLVVLFPGEIMRCKVHRVVDANRVLVEITGQPMSKTHQYRKGDVTGARRRIAYGLDSWEALDDRDFLANRSPADPAPAEKVKVKRKRTVA
jgi:hypothetical protein